MEVEWRLSNLQGEYQQRFGKKLTIRQLAAETGLSKNTIVDISKGKVKRPDENTIRVLLDCFSGHLQRQLTTNDLWYYKTISVTDHATVTDSAHVEIVTPKP